MNKNFFDGILCLSILLLFYASNTYANPDLPGFGQIIQINTHFDSIVDHPIWLIEIRDLDHNLTYPRLFDINHFDNVWIIPTYSHNYLITASNIAIHVYHPPRNEYVKYRINNFCHLESHCRIIRGRSLIINIDGYLSPNTNTYRCHITSYPN